MRLLTKTISAVLLLGSLHTQADELTPVGRWTVFDEDTGKPEAIIEIQQQHGALYGWVDEILGSPKHEDPPRCTKCEGKLKNMPVLCLRIIQDMQREGDTWHGQIMDPEDGKVYNATMSLAERGQKLEVRGYIGIPLFGRSQTWERVE
jgi:hypothetical protein